jgi:hypothetical protein
MDRAKCQKIRAVLDQTFALLESEMKALGVKVSVGRASYSATSVGSASFKVEFAEISSDGNVATRESQDFKVNAFIFGLKPEDLYRSFQMGGKSFKVVGLRTRATAKPILCESNGKQYIFPAETVKAMLALQKAA